MNKELLAKLKSKKESVEVGSKVKSHKRNTETLPKCAGIGLEKPKPIWS